jgi:RNA polymerase sigma factor (sigma-70 family)
MHGSLDRTRASLLTGLQENDPNAWRRLVRRYGPLLYRWCRAWNLQDADAQDVTQDVLVKLARRLSAFHYDPSQSFRAYLKTLARYAWCDLRAGLQQRPGAATGQLDSIPAREDLTRRIEKEFDLELLEQAMRSVRQRVEPQTWEAFRLTALENVSGADAALRL